MLKTDKIPADLELRHVPRMLNTRCQVKRGDTVSFEYLGGDDVGKRRTVLVMESDNEHVKGICLEREGEFRNFLWDKAMNPIIVPPFVKKVVTFEPVSLAEYAQAIMAQ